MQFRLEIIEPQKQQTTVKMIHVTSDFEVWRHIGEAARRLKDRIGVHIKVRDEKGCVVALTSAVTALLVLAEFDQSAA